LGKLKGKLYTLNCEPIHTEHISTAVKGDFDDVQFWNKPLGHVNNQTLQNIFKEGFISGLNCKRDDIDYCEPCVEGKSHRQPIPKEAKGHTNEIQELMHSDVRGPMQTELFGEKHNFVTFIDDYSRYTKVYLIRQKSEVL
jgi:hypothetical protein